MVPTDWQVSLLEAVVMAYCGAEEGLFFFEK